MTHNISWLEDRLGGDGAPIIIDGGMGTQLERSGVSMDGKVWSGRAVLSHADEVRQAHIVFIQAGAEVIITNTFATARHMLSPGGLGDQVKEINLKAVRLAQQARDEAAQEPVAIAGSICEWVPSDDPNWHSPEAVGDSCREQAGILAEAGVDLIALEMCQHQDFSTAAINAAMEVDLPVWIGVSAQTFKGCATLSVFDYEQRNFESLFETLAGYPVMAMNIMHTPIPDVDKAMEIARQYWSGPVGVYPESGFFEMPNWQFVDVIEPEGLVNAAQGWIANGARMVGGCCGLGPEHISALRHAFG